MKTDAVKQIFTLVLGIVPSIGRLQPLSSAWA